MIRARAGTTRRRAGATGGKPAMKAATGAPADLKRHWGRLHRGDREPFPDPHALAQLAKSHASAGSWINEHGGAEPVALKLQQAWSAFHAGQFREAIALGDKLGVLGASVANKAAAVYSLNATSGERDVLPVLEAAIERGEAATPLLSDDANVHYTFALALGRYSQRISILRALAEGLASRVRSHLERTLELEPKHAEAHVALGLYHAEIIGQLGSFAAGLTYGASTKAAIDHFKQALALTPDSPIALMEYAHGLHRLDAQAHHSEVQELYRRAAACTCADAMERLDAARAARELKGA